MHVGLTCFKIQKSFAFRYLSEKPDAPLINISDLILNLGMSFVFNCVPKRGRTSVVYS